MKSKSKRFAFAAVLIAFVCAVGFALATSGNPPAASAATSSEELYASLWGYTNYTMNADGIYRPSDRIMLYGKGWSLTPRNMFEIRSVAGGKKILTVYDYDGNPYDTYEQQGAPYVATTSGTVTYIYRIGSIPQVAYETLVLESNARITLDDYGFYRAGDKIQVSLGNFHRIVEKGGYFRILNASGSKILCILNDSGLITEESSSAAAWPVADSMTATTTEIYRANSFADVG